MNGKTGYIVSALVFILLSIYAVIQTIDNRQLKYTIDKLDNIKDEQVIKLESTFQAMNKSVIFMSKIQDMPKDVTLYFDHSEINSDGVLTVRSFYTCDSSLYSNYRTFTFRPKERPSGNIIIDTIGSVDTFYTRIPIEYKEGMFRMYVSPQ